MNLRFVKITKIKFITLALLSFGEIFLNGCGTTQSAKTEPAIEKLPTAAPIASGDSAIENSIRFFENRLKNDPEDYSANNKLAALYLQKLRETGNVQYLELASRAAKISLDSVSEIRNSGGLAALTQAEFAAHDFTESRDHAIRLTELDPGKSYPQVMLGDALVELGDYEKAEIAYKKVTLLDKGISYVSETRFARIAQLRGDNTAAHKHFANALALALNESVPPREAVAWCRWQLGETAFSVGDYEAAEKNYRDALVVFPDYYRALGSLGKVLAAKNDLTAAIETYEKVVLILPDPNYIAALGDLYKITGNEEKANNQYDLVEQIGHLSTLNGALYNRQLALFYADHDIKTVEAYNLALKEYEARKDIYGADALAWTALKAGKINEANDAIKEALRLGTEDAKIFYHAGMVARANGDEKAAQKFFRRTLELNPKFDPLQSIKLENVNAKN